MYCQGLRCGPCGSAQMNNAYTIPNSLANAGAALGRERRREPRFAVSGPCYLVWSDDGNEVCACGTIQDMSFNGLRVRTRPQAAQGDEIHVFIGDHHMAVGEVRYCIANADGGCDIGILIRHSLS